MSDRITMAKPGTQYSGQGFSLSWPARDGKPGSREVKEVPPGRRSKAIKAMILEGKIVETELPLAIYESRDLEARRPLSERLMAGGSPRALEHFRLPAGPVVRQVWVPVGELAAQQAMSHPERADWPADREPDRPVVDDSELNEQAPTLEERISGLKEDHTRAQLVAMLAEIGIETKLDLERATKLELASLIIEAAPADPADED